jgi:chromosome segregation ATPase
VVLLPLAFAVTAATLQLLLDSKWQADSLAGTPKGRAGSVFAAKQAAPQLTERDSASNKVPDAESAVQGCASTARPGFSLRLGRLMLIQHNSSALYQWLDLPLRQCSSHSAGLSAGDVPLRIDYDQDNLEHHLVHDPTLDQPVVALEDVAQSSAACEAGTADAAETGGSPYHAPCCGTSYLPGHGLAVFHTNQHVTWDQLEELPLLARQEILSLRAAVAKNSHVQLALHKEVQELQQQLAAKELDLAAASATNMQLTAELQAAVAAAGYDRAEQQQLTPADGGADRGSAESGVASHQERLRAAYFRHIRQLAEAAAVGRRESAQQVSALQMQLAANQTAAAVQVHELEMRLAKLGLSKASLQERLQLNIAQLEAEVLTAQQGAGQLHEAAACKDKQLQEMQQLLQAAQQEVADLRVASTALQVQLDQQASHHEALKAQYQHQLEDACKQVPDLASELAACKASLADAQACCNNMRIHADGALAELSSMQLQTEHDRAAATRQLTDLAQELAGVRSGYTSVITNLEAELALERDSAVQHTTESRQQLEAMELELQTQRHTAQQQLETALAALSTAELAARSTQDVLQLQCTTRQEKAAALEAELQQCKIERSRLQGSYDLLQHQHLQEQHRVQQLEACLSSFTQQLSCLAAGLQSRVDTAQQVGVTYNRDLNIAILLLATITGAVSAKLNIQYFE